MIFAIPIGQVADIPCDYAVEEKMGLLAGNHAILEAGVPSKITCMKIKETQRCLDTNWKKTHFCGIIKGSKTS